MGFIVKHGMKTPVCLERTHGCME